MEEWQKKGESFALNMRIIADEVEQKGISIEYYGNHDICRLKGVRGYRTGLELDPQFVYVISRGDAEAYPDQLPDICFLVNGRMGPDRLPAGATSIMLLEQMDMFELFDLIQSVFEKFQKWDWEIHHAMEEEWPLDVILEASIRVLRNPVFIHDAHFYILSDPHHMPGMTAWERDLRTGRQMVPISTINDFRTDVEYLSGLKSRRPVMFSSNQTGYRILFRNLWNASEYAGRILVDEVENSIHPGDVYILDYLGSFLEESVVKRRIVWFNMGGQFRQRFSSFLGGGELDERQASLYLKDLGWKKQDHFVCMRIITEQQDFNMLSAEATLGQIDIALPESLSFYYDDGISVIVNLSKTRETIANTVSRLAAIIRDGLLRAGVSSEIDDFFLIPKAYRQACIALEYGRLKADMYWYHHFDSYRLDYILDCAGREMPQEMLMADSVRRLRQFDSENQTELGRTLEVYLGQDKNVLATSRILYIHRSTLAYRLKRIQEITGANLDDPREKLKILLSYYL